MASRAKGLGRPRGEGLEVASPADRDLFLTLARHKPSLDFLAVCPQHEQSLIPQRGSAATQLPALLAACLTLAVWQVGGQAVASREERHLQAGCRGQRVAPPGRNCRFRLCACDCFVRLFNRRVYRHRSAIGCARQTSPAYSLKPGLCRFRLDILGCQAGRHRTPWYLSFCCPSSTCLACLQALHPSQNPGTPGSTRQGS